MSIIIEIPGLLQDLTGGQAEVIARGKSIKELLESLDKIFPGLKSRFFDNSDRLSNMVNIFVNEVDFHTLHGLNTPLKDGDRVRLAIAPLISGGA